MLIQNQVKQHFSFRGSIIWRKGRGKTYPNIYRDRKELKLFVMMFSRWNIPVTAWGLMLTSALTKRDMCKCMHLYKGRAVHINASVSYTREVHVVFLGLVNARVFVPSNVLPEAFDSCRVQVALHVAGTHLKDRVHYPTLSFHYETVMINTSKQLVVRVSYEDEMTNKTAAASR